MTQPEVNVTTEQIWRELSNRLRQFIQSRGTSPSDADDILQIVFLRIHQKLSDLHKIDRLESWVFQITRNAIIDHFRKKTTTTKRNTEINNALPTEIIELEESENLNKTVAGCLLTLIEHLPEDQKRAVSLYELEGFSQKEIAIKESVSLSGAKSRIQRGRKKLESLLRDCCQLQIDHRGNILECEKDNCDCD